MLIQIFSYGFPVYPDFGNILYQLNQLEVDCLLGCYAA
jgi:hypothetical protein